MTPLILKITFQKQPINATVVPIRQPPPRWIEYRRCAVKQSQENPIEKLIIKAIRSITAKEFEDM